MLEYHVLQHIQLKPLYEHAEKYLPDRLRSFDAFLQLYFRKDVMFFEIGDFAGAFWLTDIIPGWRAGVHIITWDEAAKHQSARSRAVLLEVMSLFRFRKLCAFVPTHFEAVARFTEKVGFITEGVEKLGDYYDGRIVDLLILAFFKEE
jgi:hypothetical protein